jgi:hypothetical protein
MERDLLVERNEGIFFFCDFDHIRMQIIEYHQYHDVTYDTMMHYRKPCNHSIITQWITFISQCMSQLSDEIDSQFKP